MILLFERFSLRKVFHYLAAHPSVHPSKCTYIHGMHSPILIPPPIIIFLIVINIIVVMMESQKGGF